MEKCAIFFSKWHTCSLRAIWNCTHNKQLQHALSNWVRFHSSIECLCLGYASFLLVTVENGCCVECSHGLLLGVFFCSAAEANEMLWEPNAGWLKWWNNVTEMNPWLVDHTHIFCEGIDLIVNICTLHGCKKILGRCYETYLLVSETCIQ